MMANDDSTNVSQQFDGMDLMLKDYYDDKYQILIMVAGMTVDKGFHLVCTVTPKDFGPGQRFFSSIELSSLSTPDIRAGEAPMLAVFALWEASNFPMPIMDQMIQMLDRLMLLL